MQTTLSPPTAALPLPSAINTSAAAYAGSIDSTTRSRHTDSGDDPAPATGVHSKPRFMCSYGGTIFPRPHDKALSYIGGDTRMIVVDRHTSLASLHHRLSHSLLHGRQFTLKYQLPSEELDSLISVTTDEDLENMIEEYDRTCSQTTSSSKSSRIRLFLFPLNPEGTPASSHSIGPIINNSTKSDEWFLNALNGAALPNRGFSDSATNVNCLLGLDDDTPGNVVESESQKNMNLKNQDVHSVPDSPMLETNSSFGSTSSSPSLANLPPIPVRPEDQNEHKLVGIEEQFAQFTLTAAAAGASAPKILPLQNQQKSGSTHELASPDSVSSDNSFTNPLSRQKPMIYHDPVVQMSSGTYRAPANPVDLNSNQSVQDSGYILQQQQQFLQAYYPVYPSQQQAHHQHHTQIDQQYPLYYVPARQTQVYNLPVQQPSRINDARPQAPHLAYNPMRNAPIAKPEMAAVTGVYRNSQHQQQYSGYSQIHHPSQSVTPTSTITATYAYEFTDPARAQIYYTQPLPPTMPSQYQTMTEANAQHPVDNVKLQTRTSQPI
ncbi:hypothetical protein V6N13_107920 [Hibiscus sabdariffa]|uniref:PB1 domain-containing protein n=1 Tax=Hibiscus sabdariffa TaxID=183260 RepID=A0ABR2SRI2_9ROSI